MHAIGDIRIEKGMDQLPVLSKQKDVTFRVVYIKSPQPLPLLPHITHIKPQTMHSIYKA